MKHRIQKHLSYSAKQILTAINNAEPENQEEKITYTDYISMFDHVKKHTKFLYKNQADLISSDKYLSEELNTVKGLGITQKIDENVRDRLQYEMPLMDRPILVNGQPVQKSQPVQKQPQVQNPPGTGKNKKKKGKNKKLAPKDPTKTWVSVSFQKSQASKNLILEERHQQRMNKEKMYMDQLEAQRVLNQESVNHQNQAPVGQPISASAAPAATVYLPPPNSLPQPMLPNPVQVQVPVSQVSVSQPVQYATQPPVVPHNSGFSDYSQPPPAPQPIDLTQEPEPVPYQEELPFYSQVGNRPEQPNDMLDDILQEDYRTRASHQSSRRQPYQQPKIHQPPKNSNQNFYPTPHADKQIHKRVETVSYESNDPYDSYPEDRRHRPVDRYGYEREPDNFVPKTQNRPRSPEFSAKIPEADQDRWEQVVYQPEPVAAPVRTSFSNKKDGNSFLSSIHGPERHMPTLVRSPSSHIVRDRTKYCDIPVSIPVENLGKSSVLD